jgi:hypothetical protein
LTEQTENVYENKGWPSKTDASGQRNWVARTALRLGTLTGGHGNLCGAALPEAAPAKVTKCPNQGAPSPLTRLTRADHDKTLDKASVAGI